MLLALTTLVGWWIRSPRIVQIIPGAAPMQFNTALGLLLAAAGFLGLTWRKKNLTLVTGLIVMLGGVAILSQYLLNIDLGIDQLFIIPFTAVKTSHPGRPAPNTAASFLFVGTALITAVFEKRGKIVNHLSVNLLTLLSIAALIGYVANVPSAYGWWKLTHMAVHTAVCFLVLSVGFYLLSWGERRSAPAEILILVIGALLSFTLLDFLNQSEGTLLRKQFDSDARDRIQTVKRQFLLVSDLMNTFEGFYVGSQFVSREEFEQFASYVMTKNEFMQAIEWIPQLSNYPVLYTFPVAANQMALGFDYGSDPLSKGAMDEAHQTGTLQATPPLPLSRIANPDNRGTLLFLPVVKEGQLQGFLSGVIHWQRFMDATLSILSVQDIRVRLEDVTASGIPLYGDGTSEPGLSEHPFRMEETFESFGRKYRITCLAGNDYIYTAQGAVPWIVFLLFTLMTLTVVYFVNRLLEEKGQLSVEIAERKKIERLKNDFISIVSHELRTPLTSIQGSLGLMAGGVTGVMPEQAKSLIDIALESCARLGRLVSDMLDIEKMESGKMEFDLQSLSLIPLIAQVLQANTPYAQKFGTGIDFSNQTSGPVFVRADPDRLAQVLTNLIANAVKFSPPGRGVTLSLGAQAGIARVSVSDQGPGIPQEFRSRIFQKFTQANPSDSRARSGSGLGLSISKAIVEQLGGKIDYQSSGTQGTTFYFELPVVGAPGEIFQKTITVEPQAASPSTPLRKVLCVEDDDKILAVAALALQSAGFETLMCASGQEAIEQGPGFAPDLILLDVMMPELDGPGTLRALRQIPETAALPVVFMTAKAQPHEVAEYKKLGAIGVIVKPFDPMTLGAHLHQLWTRAQERALTV